eukprot:g15741.t1
MRPWRSLKQAVSLAQQGLPDRWPRIKMLAEDVLQFDFNNAHARWLRGLALHHGFRRPKEAQDECARAVECARLQGKEAEANQWEAEVRKTFAEQPAEGTAEAEAAANAAAVREKTAEVAAPRSSMAKGFLNRTGAKKAPAESTRETDQGPKDAEAAHAAAAATAQRREAELEARVAELTAQLAAAEISRTRPRPKDSAEQRCGELKSLAQRLGELLKKAKALNSMREDEVEEDVAKLSYQVASFQMLPWDAKLQALLEDGPILWLLALMVLLGMLLTLGLVVSDVLRLKAQDRPQLQVCSFGSLLHSCQTEAPCRPCMFERVPGRCKKAWLCDFCHLHSGRKKKGAPPTGSAA